MELTVQHSRSAWDLSPSSEESLQTGTLPVRPYLPLRTRAELGQRKGQSPRTRFRLCRGVCSLFYNMSHALLVKGELPKCQVLVYPWSASLIEQWKDNATAHNRQGCGWAGLEPDSLDPWFVNFSMLEVLLSRSCSATKSDKNPTEKNSRLKIAGRELTCNHTSICLFWVTLATQDLYTTGEWPKLEGKYMF